jgi:hypothetical protein
MVHYHIRWSDSKLDWQAFSASQEAQIEAERLARFEETYTIEKFGENCPRCRVVDGRVTPNLDWHEGAEPDSHVVREGT